MRFDGKAALVTGAGSGIGRAVALRLAAEGASVLAVDVDETALAATLTRAEDGRPGTGRMATLGADLADPDVCGTAVAEVVARFGRLDVLGNIAGIYLAAHTTEMTRDQYRRLMAVNLDAYFFLAQAAIPYLLEAEGNIVNIASNAGIQGVPYSAAYCMSKGGVVQLTRSLAVEFLKKRLRVNAIAPAGTNTNIAARVLPERHGSRSGHPYGRSARAGGAGGGGRPFRLPGIRRSPVGHRRDLHAGQRAHRQLTRVRPAERR